jgi:ABC-type nitrate/sulfonate/bicarbonate transport system substrate-binding protein
MPLAEGVTALVNGNIDAHSSWQPFLNRALDAGKDKDIHYLHYNNTSFVVGAEGPRKIETSYGVFYVSTAFLSKNPRTIEALLRVLERQVAFMNANKAEASRTLATEFNQGEAAMGDQSKRSQVRLLEPAPLRRVRSDAVTVER